MQQGSLRLVAGAEAAAPEATYWAGQAAERPSPGTDAELDTYAKQDWDMTAALGVPSRLEVRLQGLCQACCHHRQIM